MVFVDAIKLIILIYNNFDIIKKVVKKIYQDKSTLSHLLTNTKFIHNKFLLIKTIQKDHSNKIKIIREDIDK